MNVAVLNTRQPADATAPRLRALRIAGGTVLRDGVFVAGDVGCRDGLIDDEVRHDYASVTLDASGLHVLPGIIDIHGDGFERLIHPRPGVGVDPSVALLEADRQFAANGITTAYHAVTWSWEGGTRGGEAARAILETLERLRPHLATDTRLHLRHETFNLAAEPIILDWITQGRIDALAFNDHMAATIKERHRPEKVLGMITRSGLDEASFFELVGRTFARAAEVPASVARLAAAASEAGLIMLSHDDLSPAMRDSYRALGCRIAEFPVNAETAQAAAAAGDPVVFGAPNVMRGGSHTGCPSAAEMAARGFCTVLASDYYYSALPLAPFRLAAQNAMPLAAAWSLVSSGPAHALNLADRGRIAPGLRADLVLVEDRTPLPPAIVATITAGRLVHLIGQDRLT